MNRFMVRAPILLAVLASTCLSLAGTHAGALRPIDTPQNAATAVPTWDITLVSANLDTVVIDLVIVGSQWSQSPCYPSWDQTCGAFQEMHWMITPCPLKFAGTTSYVQDFCAGGTFDFSPPFADNVPIRIALRAGLTYTFAGSLTNHGIRRSHDGGCDNIVCGFHEEPEPVTYAAPTVATESITWGKVKALFRK